MKRGKPPIPPFPELGPKRPWFGRGKGRPNSSKPKNYELGFSPNPLEFGLSKGSTGSYLAPSGRFGRRSGL